MTRSTMKTRFAEILRQVRKAAGLTQKQLAEKARVSQTLISRLETGSLKPSRMGAARLAAICDALPDPHSELMKALPVEAQQLKAIMEHTTELARIVEDVRAIYLTGNEKAITAILSTLDALKTLSDSLENKK